MQSDITIFEEAKIRRVYDEKTEIWFFSVVDIIRVLTDSPDSGAYWRKLKQRLKAEGSEVVTNCHGLKLTAEDGKQRLTRENARNQSDPVLFPESKQFKNAQNHEAWIVKKIALPESTRFHAQAEQPFQSPALHP